MPDELPEFAKKARDLQALRDAVVDAAAVGGGLWLSYLFVFFYLAIAAGGVSHADLFFEHPVKLPFLNVDLPLLGFFLLGPVLFLIVHAYTLLHFTFLAGKVNAFHAELQLQIETSDADTGERLRRQLPSNIFVQFLAGPRETRNGPMGFLLRAIALVSLVVGPVLLLVFFELQFLPFHSEGISWWQRFIVTADIILLWFLWPSVARGAAISHAGRDLRRATVWIWLLLGLFPVLLVFAIATFPGERLEWLEENYLPGPIGWARTLLFGDEVDLVTQHPKSVLSNRLVVPGIEIIDYAKYDTEQKIAALPATVSLRGRHLEGAVLIEVHLPKADFTGAYLAGANLAGADLRGAKFGCGYIGEGYKQQCADLRGAYLWGARLQGAELNKALLQGAWAGGYAQFRRASLSQAELQGADFTYAQLQGADLTQAELQGADFTQAQLQGADLTQAHLQGANLTLAQLQNARLDGAQLQGAALNCAQLQGASLDHVFVWRAEAPRDVDADGARINQPGQSPETPAAFVKLKQLVETVVPHDRRESALARIATIDPDKKSDWQPAPWTHLEQSSPQPKDYENALRAGLQRIGCAAVGAPYVVHGLIMSRFNERFTADPAQGASVANAFQDEKNCPGARGLSELDKATLHDLSDGSPPPKP